MSEQMTSRDIEDVLVSIRRLVTEDLRPAPRGAVGGGAKLLLTPAQRVVPEPAGSRVEAPPASPESASPEPAGEPRVDLVIAALDRALQDRQPDWESETGDPSPLRLESPVMFHTARPAAPHHAGRVKAGLPETRPQHGAAETGPDDPLADQAAGPGPTADPGVFLDLDDLDQVLDDARDPAPPWAQVEAEPVVAEPGARPVDLRDTAPPPRDPAWSAAAEAAARAELADAPRAERMDEADYDAEAEAGVIDEEMLRQIVRDVLREELAGPMGERITRNIRKLVLQEISRALSLRDLG